MATVLQCEICFESFNENERKPTILFPCSHTFCEVCVQQLGLICPSCRRKIERNSTNFIVLKLLNTQPIPSNPSINITSSLEEITQEPKSIKSQLKKFKKLVIKSIRPGSVIPPTPSMLPTPSCFSVRREKFLELPQNKKSI